MKWWENIKRWLGINKAPALPEGGKQNVNDIDPSTGGIRITRSDGTTFTIYRCQSKGVETFRTVRDMMRDTDVFLPTYVIEDDGIEKENPHQMGVKFTMQIDWEKFLEDKEFQKTVADYFLSTKRLNESIAYGGYVGRLFTDTRTGQLRQVREKGIVNGLLASDREMLESIKREAKRRDEEANRRVTQNTSVRGSKRYWGMLEGDDPEYM